MKIPPSTAFAPGHPRDRDHHVPLHLQSRYTPLRERRNRPGVQHGPRRRVADLDLFHPGPRGIHVQRVQLEVVCLPVGQIQVDGEAGGRVPGGLDPAGPARVLERLGGGRVGRPEPRSSGRWA